MQVRRRSMDGGKRLVGKQPVLVVRVFGGQRQGQLQGIAADASRRYGKRRSVEGYSHGASVG